MVLQCGHRRTTPEGVLRQTGIQPYILFAKYNPKLTSDKTKQEWAKQWYDQHIDNEDTLLFVYFAERDTDNDVGYMTLVNGKHVSSIMDAQATEIFWTYLDEYWYSDRSTDDAIVATFDATADRIMTKTTTRNDVRKWVTVAVMVIAVCVVAAIVVWLLIKRKREHERYVERMVTTPLETAEDPILNKYDHTDPGTERTIAMAILKRFGDIMRANINALLDKAEDPGKMVDQMLLDLNEDLAAVKKETASVMAAATSARQQVDECKANIASTRPPPSPR